MKRLLPLLLLLSGCSAVPGIVGAVSGAGAGAATANPAVGFLVGISVRAAGDYVQAYIDRSRQRGEQDAIADAAGNAPLGQARLWEIIHTIPIGNERGTVTPIRDIQNPLANCREVLFAVEDGGVFTTPICHGQDGWKWAAADPAVARWGFLQ